MSLCCVLDDQHAQYLTPTFALSGIIDAPLPSTPTPENADGGRGLGSSLLPMYENMTPSELEAYLAEMEPDVRAADRDMLEVETLVGKGVTGAGKLGGQHYLPFTWFLGILITTNRLRGIETAPCKPNQGA